MKNYLEIIEDKIKNNKKTEKIKITNNTHKHKKHKFFDKNKYHLHLDIESVYLSSFDKLSAQRIVMKVLENELKTKIHALEIKIR